MFREKVIAQAQACLASTAIDPGCMLVLFHTVFPWEIDGGITYSEYMLPVMITMGVLITCLQVLAITVASERETGELKRLAVLPVPPWAYVVAKCIYNTVLATTDRKSVV